MNVHFYDWNSLKIIARSPAEMSILQNLFDTLRDCDECVIVSRKGSDIIVGGGPLSEDSDRIRSIIEQAMEKEWQK